MNKEVQRATDQVLHEIAADVARDIATACGIPPEDTARIAEIHRIIISHIPEAKKRF